MSNILLFILSILMWWWKKNWTVKMVYRHIHKQELNRILYHRMRTHSKYGSSFHKLPHIHHAVCCSYPKMNQTCAANI